jgi:hypothetical protein
MILRTGLAIILVNCIGFFCQSAEAQIEGLKSRIPSDANAVVIIDVAKLFGSPAAEKGRWEARRKAAFDAGVTYLTPETSGVVIAANFDVEYGKAVWELSQVRLSSAGDITKLAARFGGEMDTIQGRSAARLPNDSIVVKVTDQNFAAYTPANRQDVSRWLASTDATSVGDQLSPYLSQAFAYVEKVGTPIIMAIDIEGVLTESQISARLSASPIAAKAGDKLPSIVKTIAGMKGVMLGVSVGDAIVGSIRVDFEGDASAIAPFGKEMLIDVLTRQGAMISDIESWTASVKGNSLVLNGPLSTGGLRRALSVLELPPSLGAALDSAESSGASSDPETLTRLASQQYYKSVESLLDDLRRENNDKKMITAGSVALWYDKYARKIDNLPLLNVDDDLLAYGRDISELLRGGEMALKSVGMRSSVRTGANQPDTDGYNAYYTNDSGYYGGYGGYRSGYAIGYNNPYEATREKSRTDTMIRSQERTRGAASAQQMWQDIESATADIRRVMTKKYNSEF